MYLRNVGRNWPQKTLTDNANDQRRGSTAAVWLIVARVLLPVLYVLSIGPANRLFGNDRSPLFYPLVIFYKPVEWLTDCCPPFRRNA